MDRERLAAIWEAFFVGDAMGMPTEFMTRSEIRAQFGGTLDRLLPPEQSKNHSGLPFASVTDDTEQNLYLYDAYCERGEVTVEDTTAYLLRWIRETGAVEKRYIGPSSLKALRDIESGVSPLGAGQGGTTCGGIMRAPCAVLFAPEQNAAALSESLYRCLLPTHNTSQALEAAGAYGFALRRALAGGGYEEILEAGMEGADLLKARAPYVACAPSSAARIARIRCGRFIPSGEDALDWLYDVMGTGLPSADVCGAVFAIFHIARKDVFQAIRLGASVGGDTDTIAALCGALSAAHTGGHNIPRDIVEQVLRANHLDAKAVARRAHIDS